MRFSISRLDAADPAILVSVDRWWDARTLALMHFGCELSQLAFERCDNAPVLEVAVECRWHGSPPKQRLQFARRPTQGEAPVWQDIEHYVRVVDATSPAEAQSASLSVTGSGGDS